MSKPLNHIVYKNKWLTVSWHEARTFDITTKRVWAKLVLDFGRIRVIVR